MLSINTNLSSLIAQRSMGQATNILNQSIERMTTGYKINHAKDNAANYSIATNMSTQISAYMVAEDNALQGLDMLNTASESVSLIEDKLMRLRALAEQSANGTYGEQSKQAINAEANALVDEINRLYSTAEYNGNKLFGGDCIEPTTFKVAVIKRDTSAMTTLKSVDGTVDLADGTYSISTADEMKKLADMTNAGLVSAGDEFVLASNIDLSTYSSDEGWVPIGSSYRFNGKFDGNGYEIRNLYINRPTEASIGLFGQTTNASISNLGLVDAKIVGNSNVAGLVGYSNGQLDINNCYVDAYIQGRSNSGGFVAVTRGNLTITDSFVTGSIKCNGGATAGLVLGKIVPVDLIIENCDVYTKFSGEGSNVSGITCGALTHGGLPGIIKVTNCSVQSFSDDMDYLIVGSPGNYQISDFSYNAKYLEEGYIASWNASLDLSGYTPLYFDNKITDLQVGVLSSTSSQISVDTGLSLESLSSLRGIGLNSVDYLGSLDKMLSKISEKQTEFGAAQNSLESALDEISIKYENLVSSRSTIRDADIAEVSSTYIQQQILQQASATLLATANQSPSIALQLI